MTEHPIVSWAALASTDPRRYEIRRTIRNSFRSSSSNSRPMYHVCIPSPTKMAATDTRLYSRLLRSMLDKESLDDLAPVRSPRGSSPGAKSRLGRADSVGSGAGDSGGMSSGAVCLASGSTFGVLSSRGGLGLIDGGGGGGREAKQRADRCNTFRRSTDRTNSDEYISKRVYQMVH